MKKLVFIMMVLAGLIASFTVFALSNQEFLAYIAPYKIFVNGIEMILKSPIVTIGDQTYIPLREGAEYLGMNVIWNEQNKTITINNLDKEEISLLYPFKDEKLWGYCNEQGNVVIKPQYYEAAPFVDGLAAVRTNSGQACDFGYIDSTGRMVIPAQFYSANSFCDGVALVVLSDHTEDYRFRYIDKTGKFLFDNEFLGAKDFHEGYAAVLKSGYIAMVPPEVMKNNKWSYIDQSGNYVTELEFEGADNFYEGYAAVKKDGKWGLIDKNFNIVIPYNYDEISKVENGMVSVNNNGIWDKISLKK